MSTKAVSVASWMSLSDAGELRPGTRAIDLLRTVASICRGPQDEEPLYVRPLIQLSLNAYELREDVTST